MKTKFIIIAAAVLLTAGFANAQTIVFTENFYNSEESNQALSVIDWNTNVTANATSRGNLANNTTPFLSGVAGVGGAGNPGYLFFNPGAANENVPWIAWTDKTAVSNIGDISKVTEVSLALNNNNTTTENIRIALKVGTDWFVSNTALNGGSWATVQTLDVKNSTWSSLTLISGTELSVGSTIALASSGNVTAVGVFNAGSVNSESVRIDNFTVAIPEPSTWALLAGSLTLLTILRRRRG